MAYAAVTSLFHTVHTLLTSPRTSPTFSTRKILQSARRSTKRLRRTLEKYDDIKNNSQQVVEVEARIRDEACKLEDLIESQSSSQFLSQSQAHGRFSLDLHHLRHDIDRFVAASVKMRIEYMQELQKPSPPPLLDAYASSASDDSGDMVGLSDLFLKIKDEMLGEEWGSALKVLLVTGMAGIGKTALAQRLYHDPLVRESYQCRVFIRVGQKFKYEDVLKEVISQVSASSHSHMTMEADEDMGEYLKRCLEGRKFLMVFDDQWDHEFGYKFYSLLPYNGYVLITSRHSNSYAGYQWGMRFLNEDESWELLQRKVFSEEGERCPPQLVKPGKKIAENCEGLPLLILTVADHLSEADKSLQYWNEVAEMKNYVYEDACDRIYDTLVSSFHYLTQKSKACFLYMGVFPRKYVIRCSRITNLWCAERFANEQDWDLLGYIVSSSLAVVRSLTFQSNSVHSGAKDFNLHFVYRHVSRKEGENSKFMCILDRYDNDDDDSIQRIEENRRLAIYHNTLLAIKEVHSYINSVTSLRSMLCTGPYHQYQVPLCLELKLVRVLDALSIRFYEFPVEVVKLIQLRYLSFTTNADLPPLINKLWFLEYLIIHQHWRINRSVDKSYVPVEVWELKELKHLQLVGRNLPHPPQGGSLPKLRNLLDVGVQSCAKSVLESIPNLEKLRIQIEAGPGVDASQAINCFDHISCINYLRSLGSVIINPKLMPRSMAPPRLLLSMNSLSKLSLSGFGYSWEDMDKIAEIPFLTVLKLQCYAFRGEKWEARESHQFPFLNCLLIEDTDLVQWTAGIETFPSLQTLRMKHCPKLKEIPLFRSVERIELVDCNPAVEAFAKQFKPEQLQLNYELHVNYSWE